MKITIEVDCTPEEARRAMGLPDVAALQERYLAQLAEGGFRPELLEGLFQGWAPMGEAGMQFWRALADATSAKPEPPR